MRVLVTGAAGFIGFHVAKTLLDRGEEVLGVDNFDGYYDPKLKHERVAMLAGHPGFHFHELDISKREIASVFDLGKVERVVHLAAQAGVRHSIENPHDFADSNLVGFLNILEGSRHQSVEHLVYASSSSVFGLNSRMPFSVHDSADHPVSLYAATKKANEVMAHSYSHVFNLPTTGLRFFTAYGPWGRPDMAIYLFTRKIFAGEPIDVFNHGRMKRDFIYVDDLVEGILRLLDHVPSPDPTWSTKQPPDPSRSSAPYRIYNLGNHAPVELLDLIQTLERHIGKKAFMNMLPLQAGDMVETYADVEDLAHDVHFRPTTTLEDGLGRFVSWFREYHGV